MNRSIIFSNTALNINKLKRISEILDNNDSISTLKIYSSRKTKENKIKIIDSQSFNSVDELINYIKENDIGILDDIEININYKNKNQAILKYNNFDHRWELSYNNQDSNIDSLIFNLKPLMRNNPFKFFRQYRGLFVSFLCGMWFVMLLIIGKAPKPSISWTFNLIYILLFIDMFLVKNVSFRENKFISRNKDNIILSLISYVLGVITPYAINLIMEVINKKL